MKRTAPEPIVAGQLWAPRDPAVATHTVRVDQTPAAPGGFVVVHRRRTGRPGRLRDTTLLERYRPVTGDHARACQDCGPDRGGPPCPGAEGICEGRGPA